MRVSRVRNLGSKDEILAVSTHLRLIKICMPSTILTAGDMPVNKRDMVSGHGTLVKIPGSHYLGHGIFFFTPLDLSCPFFNYS
jgi:hypothetical protein